MTMTAPNENLTALSGRINLQLRNAGVMDWSGDGLPHALLNLHAHVSCISRADRDAIPAALGYFAVMLIDTAECYAPGTLEAACAQECPLGSAALPGGVTLESLATLDAAQDLLVWHQYLSDCGYLYCPEGQAYPGGEELRPSGLTTVLPLARLIGSVARALALLGRHPQHAVMKALQSDSLSGMQA